MVVVVNSNLLGRIEVLQKIVVLGEIIIQKQVVLIEIIRQRVDLHRNVHFLLRQSARDRIDVEGRCQRLDDQAYCQDNAKDSIHGDGSYLFVNRDDDSKVYE